MKYKLIIFDIDGTITSHISSWRYIHERLGLWAREAFTYQEQFLAGKIFKRVNAFLLVAFHSFRIMFGGKLGERQKRFQPEKVGEQAALVGAGYFNWEDTILTADTLAYFVLSLFAQALIPLLVRFFYALQDTKGPFLIGLVSVIINIILAVFLSKPYGIIGLVISCTISNLINFCLLWIFLRIKFGSLDEGRILKSILKISVAAVFMAIVIQPMKYFLSDFVNMQTFLGIFFQGLGAGLAGIVIFATISLLLKSEEMLAIWQTIKYKLFKVKPAVITEEGPK